MKLSLEPLGLDIQLSAVPSFIAVAVTIIVLLASALAMFRANFAKQQIENLRGFNTDLVTENSSLKERVSKLEDDVKDEVSRREALEKVVTGARQLETISGILTTMASQLTNIQRVQDALATHVGIAPHE